MQHSAAFKLRVRPPYPRSPRTHSLAAKLSFMYQVIFKTLLSTIKEEKVSCGGTISFKG